MLAEKLDYLAVQAYGVLLNILGQLMPEAVAYYFGFTILIIAIVIEAVILLYLFQWILKKSALAFWAKYYLLVVTQSVRTKKLP